MKEDCLVLIYVVTYSMIKSSHETFSILLALMRVTKLCWALISAAISINKLLNKKLIQEWFEILWCSCLCSQGNDKNAFQISPSEITFMSVVVSEALQKKYLTVTKLNYVLCPTY